MICLHKGSNNSVQRTRLRRVADLWRSRKYETPLPHYVCISRPVHYRTWLGIPSFAVGSYQKSPRLQVDTRCFGSEPTSRWGFCFGCTAEVSDAGAASFSHHCCPHYFRRGQLVRGSLCPRSQWTLPQFQRGRGAGLPLRLSVWSVGTGLHVQRVDGLRSIVARLSDKA